MKVLFASLLSLSVFAAASVASAADKKDSPILKQTVKTIDGKDVELSKYEGKVLLIVNTASYCGATPQYASLQKLHDKYSKDGLVVLGFPCNQFGKQEPGTESQIKTFCETKYKVTFPLFAKVEVNGENQTPLFKELTAIESDAGPVKWNFEKFVVGRDGKVVARYRTKVKPDSVEVIKKIEGELTKKN